MTARAGEAPVPGVDELRETRVLKRTHGRMTTYRHARTGTWPINQCIPLTSPTILMSRGGFGGLDGGRGGLRKRPACWSFQYLGTSRRRRWRSRVDPPDDGAFRMAANWRRAVFFRALVFLPIYVVVRISLVRSIARAFAPSRS